MLGKKGKPSDLTKQSTKITIMKNVETLTKEIKFNSQSLCKELNELEILGLISLLEDLTPLSASEHEGYTSNGFLIGLNEECLENNTISDGQTTLFLPSEKSIIRGVGLSINGLICFNIWEEEISSFYYLDLTTLRSETELTPFQLQEDEK